MAHSKVWPRSPHECLLLQSCFHLVVRAVGLTLQQIEPQLHMHAGFRTMWRLQTRAPPPSCRPDHTHAQCTPALNACVNVKWVTFLTEESPVWNTASWPAKACFKIWVHLPAFQRPYIFMFPSTLNYFSYFLFNIILRVIMHLRFDSINYSVISFFRLTSR